jgi:integrase
MAIYKRVDTWWYRFTVNGVRYRGSCFTANEKAAQEYHDDLKSQVWRGKHLKRDERRTWAEALNRWLDEHEHKRTHLGDVSFGQWWTTRFTERKIKFLDEITPDVVKAIRDKEIKRPRQRNGKPIAPATVNRKIALLRAVINAAAREYQWLETAPLFRCLPEKNERVRFITPTEVHRLLAALEEPYRSMAKLAVGTGLRQGNVLNLTWEQVDFQNRVLSFPDRVMKNNLPLVIPINQTAMEAIRPWVGKHEKYVFVRSDGTNVRQVCSKMWKAVLKEAGISNFKWHDLRHTWASLMRQSGMGLDVIQELGGWQDSNIVKRYAHLSVDHLSQHSGVLDGVLKTPLAQIRHIAVAS